MVAIYAWLFLGALSIGLALQALIIANTTHAFLEKYPDTTYVTMHAAALVNFFVQCYVYVWCRHVSRPPIGRFGRSAVEIISVCVALVMREYMENTGYNLILLVTATLYLHSVAQVLRATPDMGLVDAFLGVFLQVLVYKTRTDMYNTLRVMMFCGVVILFRCWFYSAPTNPVNMTKKMDDNDGVC